jgi:hypothetical protein
MTDDDLTPVDGTTTIEMVFHKLISLESLTKRSLDTSLALYENHKDVKDRVTALERRVWLPALISVAAAALAILARLVP